MNRLAGDEERGHPSTRTSGPVSCRWLPLFCLLMAIVVAALFAVNVAPASASVVATLSLEQLSASAETVVYAETLSTTARRASSENHWGGGKGAIETVVELKILDSAKGHAGDRLTIVTPGGTVGDLTFYLDTAPRFTVGEAALLFLDEAGQIIGGPQGKMDVVKGEVARLNKPVSEALLMVAESPGGEVSGRSISIMSPVKVEGQSQTPESGPTTVNLTALNEGFESGISTWTLMNSPTWGRTTYRSHTGSYSAYCVGSSVSAPGGYPYNSNAWMVAGPFDLSTATTATLDYYEYLATEASYDFCYALASSDGVSFTGTGWSGNTYGWAPRSFNLASVGSSGTSFLGDSSVWIAFVFQSDDSMNYEGAYIDDVTLVTASGGSTPQVSSISPSSASAGTGTQVTITGSDFGDTQGSGRVEFFYQGSTRMSAPVVSWSDNSIVCIVPTADMSGYPGSAGSGPVTVVSSAGMASNGYQFHVTFGYGGVRQSGLACTYAVNANTPDTASEEALFDAGALTWNPASAFKFVDGGPTTAADWVMNGSYEVFWTYDLPAGVLAAAGYWYSGSTFLESDIGFNDTYTWSNGAPGTYDIQSIAIHELGHWLNLRDLYGSGDSSKVMYGSGSSGSQKRTLDPDDAAGIRWIYGNASPTVASLTPTSGPATGGTSVTITGTNFTGATAAKFGGTAATNVVVASATKITCKAPAHAVGKVDVTVTTPGGTSSISGTGNDYTYYAAPIVTALSPSYGSTAGGNTLTLTGANLTGATAVKFGTASATNVVVVNSTRITCKAPAHAVGKVDVTVTTPGGTSSTSGTGNDYTYTTRYEQPDSRLVYGGTWSLASTTSASGGGYTRTKLSGSSVVIPFYGTRMYWIATKATSMGKASVSVDGKTAVIVNLNAASTAYKQNVWNTGALTAGYHTVKISWYSGNTAGKYVSVDAVDVAGTLTGNTTYQETANGLTYAPTWTSASSTSASGGKYKTTNTSGAKVSFKFTGVQLSILARVASSYGKLSVSIDGGTAVLVDLYSKTAAFKTVWTSAFLRPGVHTVVVKRAGSRNSASTGYMVSFDALAVRGTMP